MTYHDRMDKPHEPSGGEFWQESDAYWFYDQAQGVGGFHRMGQKPAKGTGQITLFAFKEGGERFVLSAGDGTELPLTAEARQESKQIVGTIAPKLWAKAGCATLGQKSNALAMSNFMKLFTRRVIDQSPAIPMIS